jgi:VWFA-related protein
LKRLAQVALPAALFLAAAGSIPAAGPFKVRIVSPDASEPVVGKTEIAVEAVPPQGAVILKVEIYADDRLLTTLLDPPYRFTWDAGDSLRARNLRAKAYASNGSTADDRITTQAVRGAQRARVTLVEVYCTARDSRGGGFVTDLRKEEFRVLESGKPQEIAVFSSERKPVHIVLLFDASASMAQESRLEIAQEAATGFVEALEPGDTAALVVFSDVARVVVDRSGDKKALDAAIGSIQAKGGTALYDAIVAAVDLLKGQEGRKAIILLSDGRDESTDGMGPGSITTYEQALDAVLKSETAVYAIGTGEKLEEEFDYLHRRTLGDILGTMASRSGGRAHFVKKASRLKEAYREIEDELRHQYTLAYYPPNDTGSSGRDAARGKPDDWRPIEVTVSRPRVRLTHRAGYYVK